MGLTGLDASGECLTNSMSAQAQVPAPARPPIRFDRNEFAGAFGDIGTDLPLIVGMVLAARLDVTSVLAIYGFMQVLTGWIYRMPMPVQPLKAVAVMVIAQAAGKTVTADLLYGGGLAIGITMLLLTITGLVNWLGRVIPKCVVRGIQFGLGLQLTTLALKTYVPKDGTYGFAIAAIAFVISILLYGNRRYPSALFIILIGVIYSVAGLKLDLYQASQSVGFHLPQLHTPRWNDIIAGFLLLALPQVPLSIGNSILAAQQTSKDLFPDRAPGLRKISFTYSLMNLLSPFFSGIPTCHGSGGMAGHYAFGARTGGSVIIYGIFYLVLGLVFAGGFENIIKVFPLPILGVILLFEGLTLILLMRDSVGVRHEFLIVLLTGLLANGLPYGYLVAMLTGTVLFYLLPKLGAAWRQGGEKVSE